MVGAITGSQARATAMMPSGRGFAAIATTDQWLRCGHASTAIEPDTEALTLGWEAADEVTAWRPDALPLEAAGLTFDPHGCLYHADLERGQIQRVPWSPVGAMPADAAPVDLLAPPPVLPAGDFTPAAPLPGLHLRAIALAADSDEHLFVLDGPTRAVHVLDLADGRLVRTITLPWSPADLAASGGRAVLVATEDRGHPLVEISALGTPREVPLPDRALTELASVPVSAAPLRVAVGPAGERWLLLRDAAGAWAVPVQDARRTAVIPVPGARDLELDGAGRLVVAGLPGADFQRFALASAVDVRVAPLRGRNYDGRGIVRTPDGRIGFWTSKGFRVAVEARRRFLPPGHVDCFRLDSGTYQQQWGRVFVEACVPRGARVRVGFATSDEEPGLLEPHGPSVPRDPPLLLEEDDHPLPPAFPPLVATGLLETVSRPWALHRRETGSELPWLRTEPGDRFEVYEAPVQAPPGRYLWLRLLLDGTTTVTPRIRAVRAEFPGHNLLRRLPRAYSRDAVAASFLRRYLALADGMLSDLENRAGRRDLLLDPFGAPPEMLPWLASLVGLTLDERWPEPARRTMLAEAICLFRRRGTIAGLRRMLKIYLGCDVVILESFRMRGTGGASLTGGTGGPKGAATAVVGFGLRVGGEVGEATAQPLSGTVADAFQTHAHRFSVIVPRDLDDEQLEVVRHLLDLHRPAHTLVEVCTVGRGMRIGVGLHVEVSTVVGPSSGFRRAVLGSHRLGTNAVLGKPRAGVRPGGARLGADTVVDP